MNLDGNQLAVGDDIFHLQHGAGEVVAVSTNSVQAVFGAMELTISMSGLERNGVKIVGRGKPLVVWPSLGEDVTRLSALIEEGRKL